MRCSTQASKHKLLEKNTQKEKIKLKLNKFLLTKKKFNNKKQSKEKFFFLILDFFIQNLADNLVQKVVSLEIT